MSATPANLAPAVDARAAREAAQWLMRLRSGHPSPTDSAQCLAWRAASPAHELAWQRAEMVVRTLGMVPPAVGMAVLERPARQQRRASMRTLALLIGAGPVVWAACRGAPWQGWAADLRTAKGDLRTVDLADGSRLALNTETALDIRFDGALRLIQLHHGEIHIETGADPAAVAARPLVVQTAHGRIRAIGTHFSVRREAALIDGDTSVAVSQGAVEISPAHGGAALRVLRAGWQASFDANGVAPPTAVQEGMFAWVHGVLLADNTRLGELVTQLARYRPGVLRCHPAIAGLRVSGAFQLRDSDNILRLLQSSLPIQIRRLGRFWVSLEPA